METGFPRIFTRNVNASLLNNNEPERFRNSFFSMIPKDQQIVLLLKKISNLRELQQTHALITKTGFFAHSFLLNKFLILAAIPKWSSLYYATSIFSASVYWNPILCNTMIRAYSRSLFPIEAIRIYNEMFLKNVKMDHLTFPFLLRSIVSVFLMGEFEGNSIDLLRKGKEVHGTIWKLGLNGDVCVENSLIAMYSRVGLLKNACQMFDDMTEKSIASWNAMIDAYYRVNDFNSVETLFRLMPEKNVISWNMIIAGYLRSGDVIGARKMFDEMPDRDAASWNSMIRGYIQIKDYNNALGIFNRMQIQEVKPTEMTVVSLLHACAETGSLAIGRQIHSLLTQNGFKTEGIVGNALLDMYSKCGDLKLAGMVFDEIPMKHVAHWNSMIMGLALHGRPDEALKLFSSMKKVKPNRVTFLGALLACSHRGLVEEGRRIFEDMVINYEIQPDVKHHGCMVDLLCRFGFLQEANLLIRSTPFSNDPVLWRTLMAASCRHGNVKLANEAFKELSGIEAPRDGDLVLMSNVYVGSSRWEDGEIIRLDVSKQPGFSKIECES